MSVLLPFKNGVLGVLRAEWTLKLETPLVVRHGDSKAFFLRKCKKGKGNELKTTWQKPVAQSESDEWAEITDFNYHFRVDEQNNLKTLYSVPASSIRGALRNWTIRQMLQRDQWRDFSIETLDDKNSRQLTELMLRARNRLNDEKNRWQDILSLFGCTYDINPDIDNPLTWAGRLRLKTTMNENQTDGSVDVSNQSVRYQDGPSNIKCHVRVRNPLDRVTMASKDKGLHFGMEMSEGETFGVNFHVLNPKPSDIEFIMMWIEDIDAGFLRFGGLTSQGRGRVKISTEKYGLCVSNASPLSLEIQRPGISGTEDNTMFDRIWTCVEMNRAQLSKIELSKLENVIGESHAASTQSV